MAKCNHITCGTVHVYGTMSTVGYFLHPCFRETMASMILKVFSAQSYQAVSITFNYVVPLSVQSNHTTHQLPPHDTQNCHHHQPTTDIWFYTANWKPCTMMVLSIAKIRPIPVLKTLISWPYRVFMISAAWYDNKYWISQYFHCTIQYYEHYYCLYYIWKN